MYPLWSKSFHFCPQGTLVEALSVIKTTVIFQGFSLTPFFCLFSLATTESSRGLKALECDHFEINEDDGKRDLNVRESASDGFSNFEQSALPFNVASVA